MSETITATETPLDQWTAFALRDLPEADRPEVAQWSHAELEAVNLECATLAEANDRIAKDVEARWGRGDPLDLSPEAERNRACLEAAERLTSQWAAQLFEPVDVLFDSALSMLTDAELDALMEAPTVEFSEAESSFYDSLIAQGAGSDWATKTILSDREIRESAKTAIDNAHRELTDSRKAWKRADTQAKRELDEEALSKTPDIRLYTRTELAARPEPVNWVEPFLPQSEIILIAGAPGSGKSFLCLDMALRMATDTPLFGDLPVRPGKVLYIAGEGASGIPKRIAAWEKHNGLKVSDDRFLIAESGVNLSSETSVLKVIALMEKHHFDLVIADTFRKLTKVETENDPTGVTLVANNADRIRNANPGSSVAIVHHLNKAGKVNGTEAFISDFDTVWVLKGNAKGFKMSSDTDDGGKMKNSAGIVIDGMRLEQIQLRYGATSAVIVRGATSPEMPEAMTTGLDPSIVYPTAALVNFYMDGHNVSKPSAERMIRHLVDGGELITVSHGKYRVKP